MNTPSTAIADRLALALTAAREAGDITLQYFRREDLQVDRKADKTPVTIADRQAEEHLRRRIAEQFPSDAILGEEFPERPGTSGFRWILDPIDGTKSFIHGVPLYGTLVGVEQAGKPMIGVIHIPPLDECVYAAVGSGAWYQTQGKPPRLAHVSKCERLSEGLFLTSEVRTFYEAGRRDAYDRLQAAARLSRTWGDCYAYLMVVTGRAELAVDAQMSIWDAAALLPILEEAGGTFTDWQGNRRIDAGEGIATNGLVLQEVLRLVRGQ
jgi:histidinol phosphatase-like enzyme (inositol monophosphatase family)